MTRHELLRHASLTACFDNYLSDLLLPTAKHYYDAYAAWMREAGVVALVSYADFIKHDETQWLMKTLVMEFGADAEIPHAVRRREDGQIEIAFGVWEPGEGEPAEPDNDPREYRVMPDPMEQVKYITEYGTLKLCLVAED